MLNQQQTHVLARRFGTLLGDEIGANHGERDRRKADRHTHGDPGPVRPDPAVLRPLLFFISRRSHKRRFPYAECSNVPLPRANSSSVHSGLCGRSQRGD
jgi:hypothetical protein